SQTQHHSGVPTASRDLQMIRTTEQRTDFARGGIGIGPHDSVELTCRGADRQRLRAAEGFDALPIDVCDQISESIDAYHATGDAVGRDSRLWYVQLAKRFDRPTQ